MHISNYVLAFIFILVGSFSFANTKKLADAIIPSKALIIFTRESWGCINGQEVKEDISAKILKDDSIYATIQEIKNPEDVFNRNELYLIIPAKPINDLAGNFVVKFWCYNDRPEIAAYFSVDHAKLRKKKAGNWKLFIKVRGNGFLNAKMLYSRTPEIRQGWFSCPEAEIYQPYQLTFFNVYPVEGDFEGMPKQKLGGEWQTLELTFNPIFLEGSLAVDECEAFLEILDRQFAEIGRPLVWDRKKIQGETIRTLASHTAADSGYKILQVVLKVDGLTSTYIGSDKLLPHLRQKLALKNPDGKLVGGELWLRADL